MTAPTPTPARCPDCGRERGSVPADDRRMPVAYCWRDTGCYGTTHAERDCYRTAYERTSERLRRLVEAVRVERAATSEWRMRAMADEPARGRAIARMNAAAATVDALLADGDA